MRDSDFIEFLPEKKRKRHLLEKSKKRSLTLSLYEKERTYKLALWRRILGGGMTSYILLRYSTFDTATC